jgi:hypothetical protein
MTFNITRHMNISTNLFRNWLNSVVKAEKANIRVGGGTIMWAIWHVRSEFIFNKSSFPLSYRLSLWLPTEFVYGPINLQPVEQCQTKDFRCNHLAMLYEKYIADSGGSLIHA